MPVAAAAKRVQVRNSSVTGPKLGRTAWTTGAIGIWPVSASSVWMYLGGMRSKSASPRARGSTGVSVRDDAIVFDYPAKSGVRRVHEVRDPDALVRIHALKRRRGGGPQLLAYRA
jgi:hypothetical protein